MIAVQCQCLFSSLLFYYSPRGLIRRHLTIDIQQSLHYNFLANRRLRVTFSILDIIFIIVLFVCQQATIVFHSAPVALNSHNSDWMNVRPNCERQRGGGAGKWEKELNFICCRHRLVIVEVGDTDFGNYSCLAENELGKTRGYIELSGEKFWHFYIRYLQIDIRYLQMDIIWHCYQISTDRYHLTF